MQLLPELLEFVNKSICWFPKAQANLCRVGAGRSTFPGVTQSIRWKKKKKKKRPTNPIPRYQSTWESLITQLWQVQLFWSCSSALRTVSLLLSLQWQGMRLVVVAVEIKDKDVHRILETKKPKISINLPGYKHMFPVTRGPGNSIRFINSKTRPDTSVLIWMASVNSIWCCAD